MTLKSRLACFLLAGVMFAGCSHEQKKPAFHSGPEYAALSAALASDTAEAVRIFAAEGLAKLGYLAANPPLSKALLADSSSDVRRKCAELLEKTNDIDRDTDWRQTVSDQMPEVTALMTALSSDPNTGVRAASARALCKFRDNRIPAALAAALASDKEPEVRAAAAESMGTMGKARP